MKPIAKSEQGSVRGAIVDDAVSFLGIPYAAAPVGEARFAPPAPPNRWDGTRDALSYGATALQPEQEFTLIPEPRVPGDNCLNLNVFTPDPGTRGLPVLVWIHGGGFFAGCNASPWYRGERFARMAWCSSVSTTAWASRVFSRSRTEESTAESSIGWPRWNGYSTTSRRSGVTLARSRWPDSPQEAWPRRSCSPCPEHATS